MLVTAIPGCNDRGEAGALRGMERSSRRLKVSSCKHHLFKMSRSEKHRRAPVPNGTLVLLRCDSSDITAPSFAQGPISFQIDGLEQLLYDHLAPQLEVKWDPVRGICSP